MRQVLHGTGVADARGDLRGAEGFQRPHLRHARQPGLPRRVLRPRRHRQRAGGEQDRRGQLGGRPVARVLPRGHAPEDREPHAPLAERRHLGVRGAPGRRIVGTAHDAPLPLDGPRRRAHAGLEAQRRLPRAEDAVPSPVRLFRIRAGRGFLGRQIRHRRAQGHPGRSPRRRGHQRRDRQAHDADGAPREGVRRLRHRQGEAARARIGVGETRADGRREAEAGGDPVGVVPGRAAQAPGQGTSALRDRTGEVGGGAPGQFLGAQPGRATRGRGETLGRRQGPVAEARREVPRTGRRRQRVSFAGVGPPRAGRDRRGARGVDAPCRARRRGHRDVPAPDGARIGRAGLADGGPQRAALPRDQPSGRPALPLSRQGQ